MVEQLKPKAGFDWALVAWGKPHSPPAKFCSYCFSGLDEDEIPLMMWRKDGSAARFCKACMQRWWGFERLPKKKRLAGRSSFRQVP